MSSPKEAGVGANGDRREQPAHVKQSSGIKSKMHRLRRKRSSTLCDVDEEEWNRRMETWERKRKRLSGSDWDKSYREAVRNRLNGKKPWRIPISANKPLLRKADRTSQPEEKNIGQSNTIDSPQCDWEYCTKTETFFELKNDHNVEDKEDEQMNLDIVRLKRETSKMELDVADIARVDGANHCWQIRAPKQSTNRKEVKDKNSETNEGADDFILKRTCSLILTDNSATHSSTRFLKTILSPIQSESECSKLDVEAQTCDGLNTIERTKAVTNEKSSESICLKKEQCVDSKGIREQKNDTNDTNLKNDESLNLLVQKTDSSSQTTSRRQTSNSHRKDKKRESNTKKQTEKEGEGGKSINEQPHLKTKGDKKQQKKKISEKEPKKDSASKEINSSKISVKNANEVGTPGELSDHRDRSSGDTDRGTRKKPAKKCSEGKSVLVTEVAKVKRDSVGDERKVGKSIKEKSSVKEKSLSKKCAERKSVRVTEVAKVKKDSVGDECQVGKSIKEKSLSKKCAEGKSVRVTELAKVKKDSVGDKCQVGKSIEEKSSVKEKPLSKKSERINQRKIIGSVPSEPVEHGIAVTGDHGLAQELDAQTPSKHHVPVTKRKGDDEKKSIETLYHSTSFTIAFPSKERALHAIHSIPDTEIFWGRKKPPAQPLFMRTVLAEDKAPADSQIIIESKAEEPFELLAKSRPLSEDSFMVPDDSLETFSSGPKMWYREFQDPLMSSEEFLVDRMDCFKEIIIDRSGCRSLNDGSCTAIISKDLGRSCVLRYEVCHDTSKCSLKHAAKRNHVRCAD